MFWILVVMLAAAASTVGGVIGFGSGVILTPALVLAFGPKQAVPILAIASVLVNVSRAAVWWREIDWRLNTVYCATAVPAAAVGARILVGLDPRWIEGGLGLFLVALVPARRWLMACDFALGLRGMALAGAGIGFLSGLVASAGPVSTPFFLAYGLEKGAFLATEALGSAAIAITKTIVFQGHGLLTADTVMAGLLIGCSMMAGSWLAKSVALRLDSGPFRALVEALMVMAGLAMLWNAVTHVV
jgi:uncharacterized protein